MHNSIGIITWEKLCLINYHRLNHFPYKKETFPTFDVVALPGQNHLSSARATVIIWMHRQPCLILEPKWFKLTLLRLD